MDPLPPLDDLDYDEVVALLTALEEREEELTEERARVREQIDQLRDERVSRLRRVSTGECLDAHRRM